MPRVIGIIPARLGSTRFPRKVLAAQTGKPLIRHVYEAARTATLLNDVVLAVDSQEVLDAAKAFGAPAVMTRADHPNGTSRLAEAAAALGLAEDDVVVNVQGDEPELEGAVVDACVRHFLAHPAEVGTVASPFVDGEDPANPNIVKAVMTPSGYALYFSRSLIPHARVGSAATVAPLRHVGMYAYRVAFLRRYAELPATPLEQTEMLEQLRVLEHGYRICVAVASSTSQGIDTPEQYAAFVERCRMRAV